MATLMPDSTPRILESLQTENRLLREAFDAAYEYIHKGQDRGAESQARYTAWLNARRKVEAVA